ncbi:CvpA family protein [Aquibacillus salsiterrae]|uniref:CvpA family protein n=1 Tax=Aquibacillus salsiterrae TaxID=2950439 RepID=A0A9X3WAM1_9BACI|nr:CvpA family protein [Aquibacillus salsiterrae]MDC3415715.1 CvpA family protein [Aquibacillus salsiterrae]
MIDLLLLGILILGVLIGLKRGFILQLFHLIGFIVSFIIAIIYYDNLAKHLNLWIPYPELPEDATWAIFIESLPLEKAFYNAVAFALLFFGSKIILQIVASMLDFLTDLPLLSSLNGLLGGVLGFIETYFILFVTLYILALAPLSFVQSNLEQSTIAGFMVEYTPVISNQIKALWFDMYQS